MMTKQCPRKRPHVSHEWIREGDLPVFGRVRVTFACPGREDVR